MSTAATVAAHRILLPYPNRSILPTFVSCLLRFLAALLCLPAASASQPPCCVSTIRSVARWCKDQTPACLVRPCCGGADPWWLRRPACLAGTTPFVQFLFLSSQLLLAAFLYAIPLHCIAPRCSSLTTHLPCPCHLPRQVPVGARCEQAAAVPVRHPRWWQQPGQPCGWKGG